MAPKPDSILDQCRDCRTVVWAGGSGVCMRCRAKRDGAKPEPVGIDEPVKPPKQKPYRGGTNR